MKCLQYWAKKDALGFPIPGTVRGYERNPCKCDLVLIEATDTFTGVNADNKTVYQSYHPQKLRYFTRVTCEGKVLPNSLFTTLTHPGGRVAEFKKTYVAGS